MKQFKKKPRQADVTPLESPLERHTDSKTRGIKNISNTVILLIAAPTLALIITSHVFHSYEVDGMSMSTTLQDGDRLIVNKFPKTIANLSGSTYMPARYDIIVFDRPKQLSVNHNVNHLIKRVIALPGERVLIRDGKVTVYSQASSEGFNPDENKEYAKDINRTPGNVDITVGQGEVFVLGDNRTNSADSRVFGPIVTDSIVGNSIIRFLPTNNMRKF